MRQRQLAPTHTIMTALTIPHTAVIAAAIAAAIAITGCGSNFQTGGSTPVAAQATTPGSGGSGSSSGSGNSGSGGSTTPPSVTPPNPIQNLNIVGLLDGTVLGLGNIQVLAVDTANNTLLLTLPLLGANVTSGIGVMVPLNNPPGASLGIEPLSTSSTGLVLSIPLKDIVKGISLPPPTTLPNGMPIPAVPNGELPAFAVQLPALAGVNATIYLDTNIVGVFIPTFNPEIEITIPIKSSDGTQVWGYLSSIPATKTSKGGFFISIQLPQSIATVIDNNI